MNPIRKFLHYIIPALTIIVITGCNLTKSEPDIPVVDPTIPAEKKQTVLIYAVGSNNLANNLTGYGGDKSEMIEAAPKFDTEHYSVLLYQILPYSDPELLELTTDGEGNGQFVKVKNYDRSRFSTDPARISEVISDVLTLRPADSYGLVLWSHGTGWTPDFCDHIIESESQSNQISTPESKNDSKSVFPIYPSGSFGMDNYNGTKDSIDIDQLAEAIPDNLFSFIWFDCCYMGGIEVLYQLRNKADHIVASVTELMAEGMPYHLTLPLIMQGTPALTAAADQLADYFTVEKNGLPYTITVSKVSALERVAETTRAIYAEGHPPMTADLQKYSRTPCGPFYDFVQYTEEYGANASDEKIAAFRNAVSELVVYKSASNYDFNNKPILKENYSGLSCHYFYMTVSERDKYYAGLDWTRCVYP